MSLYYFLLDLKIKFTFDISFHNWNLNFHVYFHILDIKKKLNIY